MARFGSILRLEGELLLCKRRGGFGRILTQRIDMSLKIGSYDFSVKVMFLHHDNVNSSRIFEGQEAEASRSTRCTISHHSTFQYLAELREIVLE